MGLTKPTTQMPHILSYNPEYVLGAVLIGADAGQWTPGKVYINCTLCQA